MTEYQDEQILANDLGNNQVTWLGNSTQLVCYPHPAMAQMVVHSTFSLANAAPRGIVQQIFERLENEAFVTETGRGAKHGLACVEEVVELPLRWPGEEDGPQSQALLGTNRRRAVRCAASRKNAERSSRSTRTTSPRAKAASP